MAAELGWAGLGIAPDMTGFDRSLGRQLDPALTRVGRDSGKRFGGVLGKAAAAGAAGLIGAGFAAFRLGKDALGEAREAQEIGRTTAAILKATGGAAKLSRKEYDRLTASLMEKTAIDDEQIAQSGNLLLTFRNIKREGKGVADIFGRTLAGALDLSAAGFGSSDSAAKMLGKALNDPITGITALSRAGVTFSEDQKATIKSLVEQNDLLGAQKLILKEVESQVGGTAAKQKTSAKELEVAWGNVKEEIGFALIPVMDDLADVLLDKGIPAAKDFGDWLESDGIPKIKNFADRVQPLAEELLPAAGDALGVMKDVGEKLLPIAEDIVGAFNDMPDWAKTALVGGAAGGVLAKKTGLLGLLFGGGKGGGKGGLFSKAAPLPVFVVNNGIGLGDGIGGTGGKGKGGPLGALGKGAAGRLLGLASLNFLLSGDSVQQDVKDRPKAQQAYIKLLEETGAETQEELTRTLATASVAQIREWRKVLIKETGVGFGELQKLALEGGGFAVPLGLTAKDQNVRAQHNFVETLRAQHDVLAAMPDKVITKFFTPGLIDSQRDVDRLIRRFDLELDGRQVKTLYKLLGVDQAITDIDRLMDKWNAFERMTGSDNIVPDLPGPGRSNQGGQVQGTGTNTGAHRNNTDPNARSTAPTVAYYGDVTYTDDREGRRRAQQQHQRNQADGVRRGVMA